MNQGRVLLVDDCRITVLLMKHLLSKIEVRVDSATNGLDGLKLALSGDYPLIFTDVVLEGIDGFELCRRIRGARGNETRIVLLTGLGEEFNRSRAKEVGADAVFFKPIVPSQITDLVKDALRLSDTEPALQGEG